VLSFSEQAQEPWAPEIPVCVIRASYLVTTKGPAVTWVLYRLCQTEKGCLEMWPWVSCTPMESVYSGTLRPTFSLSVLLRRVSPLGNWEKALSPL
jgi:hypothetical protein